MENKDYYDTLGIDQHATAGQVKEAYRKLALHYHPDRNQDGDAAAKMKEINEAYAVLSHSDRREEYDTLRTSFGPSAQERFRRGYTDQDIFRGSDIRQVYEEISRTFGFRNFDDIFREFYGTGYRTFEFRRHGVFGGSFVFDARPGGGLKGRAGQRNPFIAPLTKWINRTLKKKWGIELPVDGKDLEDRITIPSALAGSGGKIRYVCRLHRKELDVTIPAGIKDGRRLRLKGMGGAGKGGGRPGDLYLTIRVRKPILRAIRTWLEERIPGRTRD